MESTNMTSEIPGQAAGDPAAEETGANASPTPDIASADAPPPNILTSTRFKPKAGSPLMLDPESESRYRNLVSIPITTSPGIGVSLGNPRGLDETPRTPSLGNVFPTELSATYSKATIRTIADTVGSVLRRPGERKWEGTILRSHDAYVAMLQARGATQKDIAEAHRRFSRDLELFHNADDRQSREAIMERAQRELDLFLRTVFDTDMITLRKLNANPDQFRDMDGKFGQATRTGREAIILGLQKNVTETLIAAYPRLVSAWKEMNPDSVNAESLRASFMLASIEEKARIAKRLFQDIDSTINARLYTESETLRDALIDEGVDLGDAETESLTEINSVPDSSPEARLAGLRDVRDKTDRILVAMLDENIALWARMNGGRADVLEAWKKSTDEADEAGKAVLARKLYSRIRRRLRPMIKEDLARYGKILKDTGLDTPEINQALDKREIILLGMPRSQQFDAISAYNF